MKEGEERKATVFEVFLRQTLQAHMVFANAWAKAVT